MLTLKDGPCAGTYMCKRAPMFLRAVINKTGEIDCLDQIEDTPGLDETVYIYQLEGNAGSMHLHARGKDGKNISGWYAMGTYHHLPEVDGEKFRDNEVWQEWAQANSGLYFPVIEKN